jgi:hypothetical protein
LEDYMATKAKDLTPQEEAERALEEAITLVAKCKTAWRAWTKRWNESYSKRIAPIVNEATAYPQHGRMPAKTHTVLHDDVLLKLWGEGAQILWDLRAAEVAVEGRKAGPSRRVCG